MDFVSVLLTNRSKVVDTIIENTHYVPKEQAGNTQSKQKLPTYGTQVTVGTESEKQALNQARKDRRKQGKVTKDEYQSFDSAAILGLDGERLKQVRDEQLNANSSAPLISNPVSVNNLSKLVLTLLNIPTFIKVDPGVRCCRFSVQSLVCLKVPNG
jgi:hypothetical protein